MAEGVEYDVANLDTKYFCHQCSREVLPFHSSELICPQCSTGFLEEMSQDLLYDPEIPENFDFESYFGEGESLMQELIGRRRLLSRMLDEEEDRSHDPEIPEVESEVEISEEESEATNLDSIVELLDDSEFGSRMVRYLSDAEDHMARLRYFDDYNADADVDALASQLLDEVEISGPPPLSKDQIKSLPIVILSTEQDINDLQCTVCMNDFKMGDKAKKLTCEHLFHEKCITPWLERQASCPNCRSAIKVESKSKRSLSCPRTLSIRPRSSNSTNRRFSDVSAIGEYLAASMNPFRFL